MSPKILKLIKHLATMGEPPILDTDKLIREMARGLGIPKKMLRTPAQLAAFRKRSAASKLGWRRRKAPRTRRAFWGIPKT